MPIEKNAADMKKSSIDLGKWVTLIERVLVYLERWWKPM